MKIIFGDLDKTLKVDSSPSRFVIRTAWFWGLQFGALGLGLLGLCLGEKEAAYASMLFLFGYSCLMKPNSPKH